MTNIVPANIQVPAHLADRIGVPSTLAAALAGGLSTSASYPRISIKASRFRIVEGDTETVLDQNVLDVVIVGANPRLTKTWYAKQWTPDAEPQAPDCFSMDGIRPDPEATDPQNDLCATCPQNAWGSKISAQGQQIKACADQKRLAIVAANDPSGPIYLLQVTPAALRGLNQYQKELSVRGIPPEIVKTRVSFDTDASFPKLKFTFGGFLDADTQEVVDGLFGTDRVKEITGEAVYQAEADSAATASAPVTPKPAVKVASVAESAPAPAPAKAAAPKRGFGAPKVASVAKEPAPAPAEAAAPKRGFGVSKAAPAKEPTPAPAEAAAPKRGFGISKAAPAKEPTSTNAASSLADEIAALIEEVAADDA